MQAQEEVPSFGGALTYLHPVVHRLYLVLKRRSARKEAKERLAGALSATQQMDEAIANLEQCGAEFKETAETLQLPIGVMIAQRIYSNLGKWMFAMADLVIAQERLAHQAESITHFETFMEDLKRLDRISYEYVKMLARADKDGKVDTSEFPTFMSLYLPREFNKEMGDVITEKIEPLASKVESIAEAIPPPFRGQIPPLKRGFEKMTKASNYLTPMTLETRNLLRSRSPEWARRMSELIESAWESGMKVAKSRVKAGYPSSGGPNRTGVRRMRRTQRHQGY